MFQTWRCLRRFSLIFLASLIFYCIFHIGIPGQHAQITAFGQLDAAFSSSKSQTSENPKPDSNSVQQGIEHYQNGKFKEAIALWEQALSQISVPKDRAIVHSNLAIAYRQIGQLDKAAQQWERAIEIYRSQPDEAMRQPIAGLLTEQAQAYSDLGQHKRAITLLHSALEMAQRYQDRLVETAAHGVLGNAHWALGDYEQALTAHQTSLNIARELKNTRYIATALNNLGNVYVSRAARYTYQAHLADIEGDEKESVRLTQAAAENKLQAKQSFEQSLQVARGVAGIEEVRALMNLNRLLVSKNSNENPEQLINSDRNLIFANANRARELLNTLPDSRDKTYALINLAENFKNSESESLLEQALAVARKIGDARAESFALGSLGQLREVAGDLASAMELTRTAQFAAQQINAPDSLYLWQWQAGRILKATGETEKAIAAYEQAIASLQSIRGDIVAANKDLQLDFREQVEPVYRELMTLLLDSSVLGTGDKRDKEEKTLSLVSNPKSKIQNPKSNNQASRLKKVVDTLELLKLAELQNFFGDECVQVALSQTGGEGELLDANTVVVYSVILDGQTHMILRSPDGSMTHYPVAMNREEIEQEIDQFRSLLELRATEEYLSQAQKIYDLLIRPMEADLAAAKPSILVFINDGVLRKVPMAALHDTQEFLIQKYPIAITPSLALTSRKPLNRSNLKALSLGLTVARESFAPLENVKAEVEAVGKIVGGTELIDQAFTLSNLQAQLQKNSYPIVHIATHGKFGVDAESTFLVGYDQRISIEKLDNLLRSRPSRQPIELLTLSACETAVGDNRSALGIAGVAVRAGVESALATLWYIDDAGTVPLIKEFYDQLRQPNITKAEALRRAQVKMIANVDYNHPAIWSPFILIGNWL